MTEIVNQPLIYSIYIQLCRAIMNFADFVELPHETFSNKDIIRFFLMQFERDPLKVRPTQYTNGSDRWFGILHYIWKLTRGQLTQCW